VVTSKSAQFFRRRRPTVAKYFRETLFIYFNVTVMYFRTCAQFTKKIVRFVLKILALNFST